MIRKATMDDIGRGGVDIVKDATANNSILPVDADKLFQAVSRAIQEERVIVAEQDGRVVGSVGFETFSTYYSSHTALHDMWVNVIPSHRGSMSAGRLLAALKQEAAHRNMPWFVGAAGNAGAAAAMYDRHFTPVCKIYRGT